MRLRYVKAEQRRGISSTIRLGFRRGHQQKMSKKMETQGGEGSIRFVSYFSERGSHVRRFVLKRYTGSEKWRTAKAIREFTTLNEMKQFPDLAPNIPPTVRLVRRSLNRMGPGLLLTDLTENGRYVVGDLAHFLGARAKDHPLNEDFLQRERRRLGALALRHSFSVFQDSYLFQFDPQTRMVVKAWICDAGGIFRKK